MTEKTNTPELRFPEFSEGWKEFILNDVSIKKSKKNKNNLYNETFTNSAEYGIVSQKEYFDKEISNKKNLNNYYIVEPNDFVYNPRISNLAPVGPINRNKLNRTGVMSPLYTVFSTKLSIKSFLEYYFKTSKWHRFMKLNGDSGARSDRFTIKQSLFIKMPIFLPSNQEQEKIGTFFSKLDRQIELEEEKLELLEQQKRGYMQKLFSQELRFKDENAEEYPDWSKTLIKDIFIFENNRRKPITSSLREKGNYPYYGATGIIDYVKDYLFDNEERLLIGEDGAKWGQFETSSFIANGKYWVNNHAHVVKSNNHNLYFMNYYLNFKELRTFVTGNAPAKLTHANLSSISIEMPIRNEQDKISYLLKDIENRINNQNTKIQLLQQRKKGLLQKMFV
ncbi:restriction endonuclease subunit S [Staphylococcus pettenkoferi]|uniref:restriction endonuclease subunit S n=1 Tax=Staphylococcus pettenkoferi TaxID=170573 RepID=UPI0022762421|nr:restriction endonuclease subunit S [Staphylococcus pettenkoferi]MCY1597347.1 restriction endonuclease subunit S [Staphylococcus pettenkoferi]